jgi:hypothetical protein
VKAAIRHAIFSLLFAWKQNFRFDDFFFLFSTRFLLRLAQMTIHE